MWQDDFVNFQRVGIDAGNLGRPKFHEIRCPFRGHDHAIRIRLWGRRSVQPYFAGLWVHPSDHVGALQRKVEISVGGEKRRMWVARVGIRHGIFGDLAGLGIQLADVSAEIRRIPDVAVFIRGQPVRPGLRRQLVFLELLRLGIEMSEHISHLPRVPNGSVRSKHGIMRPRTRRRHHPFLDRNFHVPRDDLRVRLRLGRKILGQIIDHRIKLVLGHRRADVHHHVQNRRPLLAVVPGVRYLVHRMANGTGSLNGCLTVAIRQLHLFLVLSSILSAARKDNTDRDREQE